MMLNIERLDYILHSIDTLPKDRMGHWAKASRSNSSETSQHVRKISEASSPGFKIKVRQEHKHIQVSSIFQPL